MENMTQLLIKKATILAPESPFHLKKKIISNNITVDFNNNLPIFLDLMNYLYPYVESI